MTRGVSPGRLAEGGTYAVGMVASPARHVERVPALFIALLKEGGKLPLLPPAVAAYGEHGSARDMTLDEVASLTWIASWGGAKTDGTAFIAPCGVLAYRDTFDYHTATDVRELIHVAGSRRACFEMVRQVADEARELGRRLIGVVAKENVAMIDAMEKIGAKQTRVVLEDCR